MLRTPKKMKRLEIEIPGDSSESTTASVAPELIGFTPKNAKKGNNLTTGISLFKGFIGTGVLAMPHSFKEAGLGLSIFTTIILGAINYITLDQAVRVADHMKAVSISLPGLAQRVLGRWGRIVAEVCILLMQFSACIGYLLFVSKFLAFVFCSYQVEGLCNAPLIYVLFALAFILPLSLISNMHYFYIPSLFANVLMMLGFLVQMIYDIYIFSTDANVRGLFWGELGTFNFSKFPYIFGISVYAFEGIGLIFPIRASMRTSSDFGKILRTVMFALTIMYLIFSSLSYIAFGESTIEIIFFNLPIDSMFYLTIQVLYAFALIFTYPLAMYPALQILETYATIRKFVTGPENQPMQYRRYILRNIVNVFVFLIAFSLPSFGLFINLIGSLVYTYISFILTTSMYNKYFEKTITNKEKYFNYMIMGIGAIAGIFGTVYSIIAMFDIDE